MSLLGVIFYIYFLLILYFPGGGAGTLRGGQEDYFPPLCTPLPVNIPE